MLDELRRRAEEAARWSSRLAAEFERDVPFGVWIDALDAYVAAHVDEFGDGADAALLAELAGVLPSVRAAGANRRPSPTSATAHTGPCSASWSDSRRALRSL